MVTACTATTLDTVSAMEIKSLAKKKKKGKVYMQPLIGLYSSKNKNCTAFNMFFLPMKILYRFLIGTIDQFIQPVFVA